MLLIQLVLAIVYTHIASGAVCGGSETAPSKILTSPNYPKSYGTNETCIWTITVANGSRVKIEVSDLNLHPKQESSCEVEYLMIKNPKETNANIFCGNQTVPTFISKSNVVTVEFDSDSKDHTGLRGFQLTYSTVTATTPGSTTTQAATNTTDVPTTNPPVTPKPSKKLPGWCIALIVIAILIIIGAIVGCIYYRRKSSYEQV